MQSILNIYYKNNASKLHRMVDKLLLQFGGIENKDRDDFYSLANEVFVDVLNRYDREQPFETFLYSCLDRKIKTEITRRNRSKRQPYQRDSSGKLIRDEDGKPIPIPIVSLNSPIGDDENKTIEDLIKDTKVGSDFDIDKTFFEDNKGRYSEKMSRYINRLSIVQREVVKLMIVGYSASEIKENLHISNQEYTDSVDAIRSYRNVSILF